MSTPDLVELRRLLDVRDEWSPLVLPLEGGPVPHGHQRSDIFDAEGTLVASMVPMDDAALIVFLVNNAEALADRLEAAESVVEAWRGGRLPWQKLIKRLEAAERVCEAVLSYDAVMTVPPPAYPSLDELMAAGTVRDEMLTDWLALRTEQEGE